MQESSPQTRESSNPLDYCPGATLGSLAGSVIPADARNLYGKFEQSEVGQGQSALPSRADLPLDSWEVPEGWLGPRRCTLWAHLFQTLALWPVLLESSASASAEAK